MALDDFMQTEVGIAVAATAVVFSPQARNLLRRGAVYGLAALMKAGDTVGGAARGLASEAQNTASDGAAAAQSTVAEAKTVARGRGTPSPRTPGPGTSGTGTPSPRTPGPGTPGTRDHERVSVAALEDSSPGDPELARAEEMIDRTAETVGAWASQWTREILKGVARAREEAEDIWAEAKSRADQQG